MHPAASLLFSPAQLGSLRLRNRWILAPMCQYAVTAGDGAATDWHLMHYGARAAGGFGLVTLEACAVAAAGRISPADLGIWDAAQLPGLARIVALIHSQNAAAGIQLAHAGAKASTEPWLPGSTGASLTPADGGWATLSPSGINPVSGLAPASTMTRTQIEDSLKQWAQAAARAAEAGFDLIQIHAAHGYLIHQFLSPLTNQREDDYGGSPENRSRYLRDVIAAIRTAWPAPQPLTLRISGSDWVEGSWSIDDSCHLVRELAAAGSIDGVDVSSGGMGDHYTGPPPQPGYQLPLAGEVKAAAASLFISGVGKISSFEHAAAAVTDYPLDGLSIGRAALANPHWVLATGVQAGLNRDQLPYPPSYWRAGWPRPQR